MFSMGISARIVKRIITLLIVTLGVVTLSFCLQIFTGTDPAEMLVRKTTLFATEEQIQAMRVELGLDGTLSEQYADYIKGLLTGDLGISITNRKPVIDNIRNALPVTCMLVIMSMLWVAILTVLISAFSVIWKDKAFDHATRVICIIGIKSTQNRYFVGSRLLELPELKLLVDAVESSHLITEKKSTALIEKLGHLTSRHNAALLNRPVYMDGTAKPDNEAVYYAIDAIQTAIHKQRAISFQYFEYTPKKEKVLKHKGYRYGFSPYVLIWSRDFYYAVGWSEKHGKLAQFRVDRMTAIQDSDAPYIADPSFDPASYIREIFGMYHDMPQRVTLLCENRTMRNIIDHFGEDVDTEVVDANHFRATVDVAPTPPFFSWVFTFGGAIRIEGPGEALAKMRDMASWLHT